MPTSTPTYSGVKPSESADYTDILVTSQRKTRRMPEPETQESDIDYSPSRPKPRKLNHSRKVRRDIGALKNDYETAPSAIITFGGAVSKADEREEEDKAVEAYASLGEDAVSDAKVIRVRKSFPWHIVALCLLLSVMIMYMLSLFIKADGYRAEINSMSSHLISVKEEETQLLIQLESKFNLADISKIAQEEYGMVSADSLPKKYIVLTDEDTCEILEDKSSESIGTFLSPFGEWLRDLLE